MFFPGVSQIDSTLNGGCRQATQDRSVDPKGQRRFAQSGKHRLPSDNRPASLLDQNP